VVAAEAVGLPTKLDTPLLCCDLACPWQVVDCTTSGPMRCSSCKAYVNPYMRWVEGGRVMQCAFCGASTEVPPDYQCFTGPDGERRDKHERPELCRG
jgi:protein transport protein SEC24